MVCAGIATAFSSATVLPRPSPPPSTLPKTTYALPLHHVQCPSVQLRFHPFFANVSVSTCTCLINGLQGVPSRVPERSVSIHGKVWLSTVIGTCSWNENFGPEIRETRAPSRCPFHKGLKCFWRKRKVLSQPSRCNLERRTEERFKKWKVSPFSQTGDDYYLKSPYGLRKWTGRNRFSCQSSGSEDDKDAGKTKSTATEEPDDSKPKFSRADQSDDGPSPGLLNVELDAFKLMELVGPEKVDPADVQLLKEKVFGYTSFWVTKQEPFGNLGEGVLLLGNLRGRREEVFTKLQQKLREVTGTKYNLYMIEEPNSEDPDPRGGPRVSFVLLRKEVCEPRPTSLWQYVIAFILFVLTAGSCLELGIASQLTKLPPEVVQYFTNPEIVDPPDLQAVVPYVESAMPLAYGVLGVQVFHEVGHLLAASPKKVKLGIPYLIPNITLGSFGAITQFKSVIPDRTTKFDISMAGPLAGGLLSGAMLGVGLLLSTRPEAISDLVQVPSVLFQGSFLLGLWSKAALGYDVMHAATVAIHPLVISGWCGLTTTAFNLLPVGCLDGGKAMEAAFGKNALTGFGLITYVLLGFGLLGGPLSLAWGLYILICQRTPEKPCLNDVTEVGPWRQFALIVTGILVVLTLLPFWDNPSDIAGIDRGLSPF